MCDVENAQLSAINEESLSTVSSSCIKMTPDTLGN